MNIEKWLKHNTTSLSGKLIAITGSTGGLGGEICRYLLKLGASLILLDRNAARSDALRKRLTEEYEGASVRCINVDLESIDSVRDAVSKLICEPLDVFIHNAGAYSIPRCTSNSGYDNVFTINFASPYYMVRELMPTLKKNGGRVVIVGSIAHNYSKISETDMDFSHVAKASKVYGNAKRFLMFSSYELFKGEDEVSLSVTHPGITFTNITAHYPKLIFAIIKNPMKVIFMSAEKAALCIVKGLFDKTEYHTWYGPRIFNVWGLPSKKALSTCALSESGRIAELSENVYLDIKSKISQSAEA